jgi:DNA polymerase-3 subunit delta'
MKKIIGQSTAIRYLLQAVSSERLPHSFLFSGPDGVGKKTTALAFVQGLHCLTESRDQTETNFGGCGECEPCQKVENLTHPDIFILNAETQAALIREKAETQRSVKIEAVREIDKFLQLKPLEGHHRIAIIEEADTLTPEAANALLKTLEEPPANGRLILLADNEKSILPTILSRCARIRFRPVAFKDIGAWLNKVHGYDADTSLEAAALSGGSFSKALQLAEDPPQEGQISNLAPDDFFDLLGDPSFRRESRERAARLISHLLEKSRRKLGEGDPRQKSILETLLQAERQLNRYVTPRVVLESVYMALKGKSNL